MLDVLSLRQKLTTSLDLSTCNLRERVDSSTRFLSSVQQHS